MSTPVFMAVNLVFSADAATVCGTVDRGHRGDWVYIEAAAGQQGPATEVEAAHVDRRFVPSRLLVIAGTTVTLPNRGPGWHDLSSGTLGVETGSYRVGAARHVTFHEPGEFELGCAVHPESSLEVRVLAGGWMAPVEKGGQFCVTGVSPGLHTLVVWAPARPDRRREVLVPVEGKNVSLASPL